MASVASSDKLVLKIQLEREGAQPECYRKRVDASLNFAQLQSLIGSLLPSSRHTETAVLTYLDGDLDEIRIKDDDDLREALLVKDEKNSDTLRLTVKLARTERLPSAPARETCAEACKRRKKQERHCKRNACPRGFPPPFLVGMEQAHTSIPDLVSTSLGVLGDVLQRLEASKTEEEGSSSNPSPDTKASEAIHYGVVCDGSGQYPLRGRRFKMKGRDYDLCESEFKKLSAEEQKQFVEIEPPKRVASLEDVLQRANLDILKPLFYSFGPCKGKSSASSAFCDSEAAGDGESADDVNLQTAIERSLDNDGNGDTRSSTNAAPAPREEPLATEQIERPERTPSSTSNNADTSSNTILAPGEESLSTKRIERSEGNSPSTISKPATPISHQAVDAVENADWECVDPKITGEGGEAEGASKGNEAPVNGVQGRTVPFEKEIQMLQSMGFYDVEEIRTALRATDGTADTHNPSLNVQYALQRLLQ